MTSRVPVAQNKVVTVVATAGYGPEVLTEISYTDSKIIGNGSFGVVFQAKLLPSNEQVAIKKVLQDRRFKNRELLIMRKLSHINIVKLRYFFYSSGDKRDEVYLNLVMELIPDTLYKIERNYARSKQTLPVNYVRLYMYQLFRSLAFVHSLGFCHRDIKPQNLLIDADAAVLKLCDFGSAKQLIPGEPNVSYICSRYYRAPELIFGSSNYTAKIDIWSAGCVMAELLLGQLIFPGDSGVDQIVEIVKVMGTPTPDQLHDMNPNYKHFKLPQLKPHPWQKVFRIRTPTEAIDLVSKLLIYSPQLRVTPLTACAHPFFDELRQEPNQLLPNGRNLPPLFNFTDYEMTIEPNVMAKLQPTKAGATPHTPHTPADSRGTTARSSRKDSRRRTAGEEQQPQLAAAASGTSAAECQSSKQHQVKAGTSKPPKAKQPTAGFEDLGNGDHLKVGTDSPLNVAVNEQGEAGDLDEFDWNCSHSGSDPNEGYADDDFQDMDDEQEIDNYEVVADENDDDADDDDVGNGDDDDDDDDEDI